MAKIAPQCQNVQQEITTAAAVVFVAARLTCISLQSKIKHNFSKKNSFRKS